MWQTIGIIVAVVNSTLAIGGLIYGFVYWKGEMDTWRKAHDSEHKQYPISEISLMCKTLWECYALDALRRRPDLAKHSSPYTLTKHAHNLIPDHVKEKLSELAKFPFDKEALATGWLVVKYLGFKTIEDVAKEKDLSVQETVAILSTYIDNATNNGHPTPSF